MNSQMNTAKDFLRPFVPAMIFKVLKKQYLKKQFREWQQNGRPVPPPHLVKQMAIREYQEKYGYGILVESGTFRGDMVEAQKKNFKKIISIELSVELFKAAQRKFRNDNNVEIVVICYFNLLRNLPNAVFIVANIQY